MRAKRIFEQRIDADRQGDAVRQFVPGNQRRFLVRRGGGWTRILSPFQVDPGFLRPRLRSERLATGDQRNLCLAARDAISQLVDHHLRAVAANSGVDESLRFGTNTVGKAARQVGIMAERRPESGAAVGEHPDHRHRIDGCRHVMPSRVCHGPVCNRRQHLGGGQGLQHIVHPAVILGDANQNGGARIDHQTSGKCPSRSREGVMDQRMPGTSRAASASEAARMELPAYLPYSIRAMVRL